MAEICPYHSEHAAILSRLKEDTSELFEVKDNHTRALFDLDKKCSHLDKFNQDAQRRLDDHESLIKAIAKVGDEMSKTNDKLSKLLETQEIDRKRIELLEQQPALDALARQKRVKELILTVVVTSAASGTIAYVIALSKLVVK